MAADPISGVIDAGVGGFGSLISLLTSATDRDNAAEAMQRAAQAWNIPLPVLQQMVAQQLPPSQQAQVFADPNLQGDQSAALGELQNLSDSGGMTLTDKVNNDQLQQQAAQKAQAQRQSIVNVLSRQGVQSGGVSAALQLGAARDQQAAEANAAAQTAADARKRATEAVLQRGQLAGQMRTQGTQEASARATAADQIAKYNADATQKAQAYNLSLPQQQFENQTQRAAGIAGTGQSQAQFDTNNANRTQQFTSDFGSGVGKAASGAYQAIKGNGSAGAVDPTADPYAAAPTKLPEGKVDEYGNPI